MDRIAFAGAARALLLLHAAAAVVLVGSSTHHLLIVASWLRGRPRRRLLRVYAAVQGVAFAATFSLGAFAYPAYRYFVRGLYFDRYAPWASNLFDMKENWAALGIPLVAALAILSRFVDDEKEPLGPAYALLAFLSTAIVWFSTVSGLIVTMERAP